MDTQTAQDLHDQLLTAQPEGSVHEPCELCTTPPRETAEEVAVPEPRTFTEAEHEAILERAVTQEVERASQEKDGQLTELQSRLDVLEAEKASAETARDEAKAEFEQYKADIEQAREVEARKGQRVAAIKEVASDLPESYFAEERIARWAEMADEQFGALLDDLAEAAITRLSPEEAKQLEGLEGDSRRSKLTELNESRAAREAADDKGDPLPVRQTAAFAGGTTPTAITGGSNAQRFLTSRNHLPHMS